MSVCVHAFMSACVHMGVCVCVGGWVGEDVIVSVGVLALQLVPLNLN